MSSPSTSRLISIVLRRGDDAGCPLTREQAGRMAAHLDMVQHWNRRIRLVGSAGEKELVDVHTFDGLVASGWLRRMSRVEQESLVDVGSGAGFPGLVIAVAVPGLRVTLCEHKEKRFSFLAQALHKLGVEATVEENGLVGLSGGRPFDHAISRATFAPEEWMEKARGIVRPGGLIWCMTTEPLSKPHVAGGSYRLPDGRPRFLGAYVSRETSPEIEAPVPRETSG